MNRLVDGTNQMAAPDLLVALKRLHNPDDCGDHCSNHCPQCQATAAIAKANSPPLNSFDRDTVVILDIRDSLKSITESLQAIAGRFEEVSVPASQFGRGNVRVVVENG